MSNNKPKGTLVDQAIVVLEESCIGCRGCVLSKDQMNLPRRLTEVHPVTAFDQIRIMWNSLGKPIFFLILASLIADLLYLNEHQTVIAAIVGFFVGYFNCIVLTEKLLEKVSVS